METLNKTIPTVKNFDEWLKNAIVEESETSTWYIMLENDYEDLIEIDTLGCDGWYIKESCFELSIEIKERVFEKLRMGMLCWENRNETGWSLMEEGYPEMNLNR